MAPRAGLPSTMAGEVDRGTCKAPIDPSLTPILRFLGLTRQSVVPLPSGFREAGEEGLGEKMWEI